MIHHIIGIITFVNTGMAKYTNKELWPTVLIIYMPAVYRRFPLYVLAQCSQKLSEDDCCNFHYVDMDVEIT